MLQTKIFLMQTFNEYFDIKCSSHFQISLLTLVHSYEDNMHHIQRENRTHCKCLNLIITDRNCNRELKMTFPGKKL